MPDTAEPAPAILPRRRHNRILLAIALFKFVKCALLLAVAFGALKLLHGDISPETRQWIARLAREPQHHALHELLHRVLVIDDRHLRAISAASLIYAVLLGTEGIGLWLERRWGEYFTILITGSFIPLEVYELADHPNLPRLAITCVNVAAVAYLVVRVKRGNGDRRRTANS